MEIFGIEIIIRRNKFLKNLELVRKQGEATWYRCKKCGMIGHIPQLLRCPCRHPELYSEAIK